MRESPGKFIGRGEQHLQDDEVGLPDVLLVAVPHPGELPPGLLDPGLDRGQGLPDLAHLPLELLVRQRLPTRSGPALDRVEAWTPTRTQVYC